MQQKKKEKKKKKKVKASGIPNYIGLKIPVNKKKWIFSLWDLY